MLVLGLTWLLFLSPPQGPAEPSSPESPASASDSDQRSLGAQRAAQIHALIEGTLPPHIDERTLFEFSLRDLEALELTSEELLQAMAPSAHEDEASTEHSGQPRDPPVEPLNPGAQERIGNLPGHDVITETPRSPLATALARFFALPATERQARLDEHAAQRQIAETSTQEQAKLQNEIEQLNTRATHLDAFMNTALDSTVDPAPLVAIDLVEWTTEPSSEVLAQPLNGARTRFKTVQMRYLSLTPEERDRLWLAHEARQTAAASEPDDAQRHATIISQAEDEASRAAAEREQALETARQAKTEAKRIVAEERARLLGVKEAHARYEAELNRRRSERDTNHELTLEWSRKVGELDQDPRFPWDKAPIADALYEDLRNDLAQMRHRLKTELRRLRDGHHVPAPGPGFDAQLPADVDRSELDALRTELLDNERRLAALEREIEWALAEGLRNDVVQLNQNRLSLLNMASPSTTRAVTGFGPAGVDQVGREFEQISVEVAYQWQVLSHDRQRWITSLRSSTLSLMIGTAKLFLILALYGWWRRRSPTWLAWLRAQLEEAQPPSTVLGAGAATIWYIERVRRPFELLLVLWVVLGMAGPLQDQSILYSIWLIALWVLLGWGVIQFIDALAARETLFSASEQDSSSLRMHSLRVVGITTIAIGLILSLTAAVVGEGAIYTWVISTCWILSLPVAFYLTFRWRPIILERIARRPGQNAFTQWVLSNSSTPQGFIAAAMGALYLLGAGLSAWSLRQLSGLETTRRLLAFLFRREVAKQAASQGHQRFTPIDGATYARFDPELQVPDVMDTVATSELDRVLAVVGDATPTLTAIVGERGSGKSVLLRRLGQALDEQQIIHHFITCPDQGFEALFSTLAQLIGQPDAGRDELVLELRSRGRCVIAIDDIQRLVIPAVNGLRGLDAFTSFVRDVRGEISWVITMGSAAWTYLKRARGDRVFFDETISMPRWTEEQLGDLIRARCKACGLDPSFDGLVVPRQTSANPTLSTGQGDRTESGYYRLLWDFSNGNPAVALHAFRESLFVSPSEQIVVRLFKEPHSEEVENLPLSILFVLRVTVQLELATANEIIAATKLPSVDVEHALRYCTTRGYLEPFHEGVRIGWPWYRTITTVLRRQHLLSL